MTTAAESAAVEAMLGFDGGGHADDDDDDDAEGALVSMSGGGVTAMPKQKTCRYDSSLGLLTKKFVQLIQNAPLPAINPLHSTGLKLSNWLRSHGVWS